MPYPGTKYEGHWECSELPVEELGCDSDDRLRSEELRSAIVMRYGKGALGKEKSTRGPTCK
jgi:hypothetical protein